MNQEKVDATSISKLAPKFDKDEVVIINKKRSIQEHTLSKSTYSIHQIAEYVLNSEQD